MYQALCNIQKFPNLRAEMALAALGASTASWIVLSLRYSILTDVKISFKSCKIEIPDLKGSVSIERLSTLA